jgi:hypothetical protein
MSGITAAVAPVGIVRRPRIVLGGRIVVARRRWLVEHTAFPPAEGGGEDDADVFLRVNLWRKALGIPDRVYVVVFPNQDHVVAEDAKAQMDAAPEAAELDGADVDAGTEPDEGTEPAVSSPVKAGEPPIGPTRPDRRSRDYVKPQYIDFTSPLLVALFIRLPVGLRSFKVVIEESYPERKDLITDGTRAFASELVLQVDRANRNVVAAASGVSDGGVAYA